MAEIKIFKDLPIAKPEEDELNFGQYADALVAVITGVPLEDLPFSIGVYGEWGSGKSTLMGFTQSKLSEQKIKTVLFNPWKYDRKEALWNALINEIFFAMEQDGPNTARFYKAKEKAVQTFMAVAWGGVRSLATAVGGGGVMDELHRLRSETFGRDLYTFVQQFEEAFRDVVRAYVKDTERLVVFIDDIDRCLPENAITVLESLKLFLDKAPCVFVIGADQSVIQYGIGKMYGAEYASRDYLEKIIQVPFRVPRVLSKVVYKLWDEVKGQPGYDEVVKELAEGTLGYNLRQWKRFLNAYVVATTIANARGVGSMKAHVAARAFAILLQMRFPEIYDVWNKSPDEGSRFLSVGFQSSTSAWQSTLSGLRLDSFVPFVEKPDVTAFFKLVVDVFDKLQGEGQSVSATRLQEAFSCVPL